MSQYIVNNNTESSNNGNAFGVRNSDTATDSRSQLLAWLSPLSPILRHRNIQEHRVNDVGEWILETEEFRRWYAGCEGGEGERGILFCYGDPGIGKTFISSLVVDRLCDQTSGQNTAVSCFYLDFTARKEQPASDVLGSMLKQIVGGMEKIPEEISRIFQQQRTTIGGRRPQLVNIVKMIQCITSSRRIFMCLDALDECAGAERFKLLDSLKEILEQSPETRIFMTGRPNIRAEVKSRLAGQVTSFSISSRRADIISYLLFRMGRDETPDAMDESLKAEILRIPQNMSEIFRLASLNLEATLQEPTIYRRQERLRKITNGLGWGDAYGATIERIKAQGGDKCRLGMGALIWVSHAERPLRADELCHAMAVELGSTDFDVKNVPSTSTLVSCCQGLITVDKEKSTVRLIHFTLKEYLSARPDIFIRPHSEMAEICLTYLNSRQVKALSADAFPYISRTSFLRYCSRYWGAHAKRDLSDHAKSLALELFQYCNVHISVTWLLAHSGYMGQMRQGMRFRFSGLHWASFFGIAEVAAALIAMESYDINEGDFWGNTPLSWAANHGHEGVVKILLRQAGINPDKADNNGNTPLSLAALGGHEGVVSVLLEWDEVNPNKADNSGSTPLSYAAWGGHGGVVKVLLERDDVDPEKPDNNGRTPLQEAARGGHEAVVKILLAREEVNPDKPDNHHSTPLSLAAEHGQEDVVKVLLGRQEVDPENLDDDGDTPLSCAALGGSERVVKTLLEREEVNPDNPNNTGQTPLSIAACRGHEGVVKILLKREGVIPNKADNSGQTPLMHAARRGYQRVIELLQPHEVATHVTLSGSKDTTT